MKTTKTANMAVCVLKKASLQRALITSTVKALLMESRFAARRAIATKEDIGKITAEIENVKVAIQTLGQLKIDYEQQRRDWLLSFYDTAVEMRHDTLAVNFGDLPMDEGKSLFAYQQQFSITIFSLATNVAPNNFFTVSLP